LSLLHPAAQAQFSTLVAELARGPDGPQPSRSIAAPRQEGLPPLVLSAVRLSAPPGRLAASRPCILVLLTDAVRRPGAEAALLRDAYGLTPVEARLACMLADGLSLRRSAERAGLTYETARSYLKILFQKTGTHRQADLVPQLLATGPLLNARSRSLS
jgi:DNA-binding CsgD family transcriptional regulator